MALSERDGSCRFVETADTRTRDLRAIDGILSVIGKEGSEE